jgi:UDP-glucuronate 4-epimerase
MGLLLDVESNIIYTDEVFPCTPCDTTHLHNLIGKTKIDWKEGMRMLVEEGAVDSRRVG